MTYQNRNLNIDSHTLQLKIKEFVVQILDDLAKGKPPSVSISKYQARQFFPDGLSYTVYERTGSHESINFQRATGVRRLVIMLRFLEIVQKLLEEDRHASKRDIYYSDPCIFQDPATIDQAINDICIYFECNRSSLHVVSVSKGLVMGWLTYTENNRIIDCMSSNCSGFPITVRTDSIHKIKSSAEYILVVEKETVFQRLANDGFCISNRCIVISGKGYPDIATRSFIRLLTQTLRIPAFALVDGDPHGVDILLTYKFGSLTMAYDAEALATPEIHWLGMFLSDCETFGIDKDCLLPMTGQDKRKASAILKRNYVTHFVPSWRKEIERMLCQGVKLEIEAVSSISLSFLTKDYLPFKMKNSLFYA